MTIAATQLDRLLQLLRVQSGFEGAELEGPPEPLSGGFWASLYLLHLLGVAPPADTLVLRVMPDDALAAKETVFQREIAAQGFPVPAVRLAGGRDAGLDAPFLLMDHSPGDSPLAGLDGLTALRRLPSLARRLPELLGHVTAQLHTLDPEPVRAALTTSRVIAPTDVDAFVAALSEWATGSGRADLAAAARWLAAHPPPASRVTICHGDLHPFNLLVDGDGWTLLDWTAALVAQPGYDVAFTTLMLRHPPLVAPAPLRPIIAAAGAAVARRFLTAYRGAGGDTGPPETLNWYANLHALRILLEVEGWRQSPAVADHSGHPWVTIGPVAARLLARTTDIPIAWAGAAS